jgi:hypothetical protein
MEKWIVLISSILLLAFLCWKEIRRKNKARLRLRLVTSVLAIAALYFIASPISFQRKLDPSNENTAVILTAGFVKDSLTGLKNIPAYSNDRSIATGNKNVKFIPDLEYFSRSQANITRIHILGVGLDQHELEAFRNHKLIFHPGTVAGFTSVQWNRYVRSGEKLSVQGYFKSASDRPVKILLRGLSTTLDSAELSGSKSFELNTTPKLLDKTIYSLIALSGMDTLANEKIPVFIEKKSSLKILMLSSSPDFESKFLKNWLYAERYGLAIRRTISKEKFSTEFLNIGRTSLNRINPAVLENFDILIGDMSSLSELSAAENTAIQNEVIKGMGLFIRADSTVGGGFYRRAFTIRTNRAIDPRNLILSWDKQTAKKSSTPSSQVLEIIPRPGEQLLVRDNKNHILASSKLYGAGRLVVSTVPDTYTWMLSNNSAYYSSYWSHILEKAARKSQVENSWAVLNNLPVVHSPVQLQMESSSSIFPSASIDDSHLHLSQNAIQSTRWTAQYWPTKAGWEKIPSGDKDTFWYVFDDADWLSVRRTQKIQNTTNFISSKRTISQQSGKEIRTYKYTIPAIYFFIVFLICCGYLWIERKLG